MRGRGCPFGLFLIKESGSYPISQTAANTIGLTEQAFFRMSLTAGMVATEMRPGVAYLLVLEGEVKHFFGGLSMFRKLMMGPALSLIFMGALAIGSYLGIGNTILLALLGAAMVVPFVVSAYAVNLMGKTLQSAVAGVRAMATGDLTTRIDVDSNDEIGAMATEFNTFVDNLRRIMVHLAHDGDDILSAGTKMDDAVHQMVSGFEAISGQMNSIAVASEELTATSAEIARNCEAATHSSKQSTSAVSAGGVVIDEAVAVMTAISEKVRGLATVIESLGQRSDQVGQVVGLINDIADQTNLLALNAAIEAARAGEQGRGFAVVADEVRKLAERTTEATREIAQTITAMQAETKGIISSIDESVKEVELGTEKTDQSKHFLSEIAGQIAAVDAQINQIAVAVQQENATTEQTANNIAQVSQVVYETSMTVTDTAPAATKVVTIANALEKMLEQFIVSA
jgi:methyl-accepting chemotaxis protein